MIFWPPIRSGFSRPSRHPLKVLMKIAFSAALLLILWSGIDQAQDTVGACQLSGGFSFPAAFADMGGSMEFSSPPRPMELSVAGIRPSISIEELPFGLASSIDGSSFAEEDTLQSPPQRRLLPDKLSFVERGLWDETGLMRKIGLTGPLTPESRKRELVARRTMLTIHQIGGFVTLGLMSSAAYTGQQVLNGRRQFRHWHQGLVAGTIASYSVTGLLAVLSPPPLIRRDEVSTTTIHKTLAWVHFLGMVVTPILGATLHRTRTLNYDQTARFHQVSAYVTTAALATSLIVITF